MHQHGHDHIPLDVGVDHLCEGEAVLRQHLPRVRHDPFQGGVGVAEMGVLRVPRRVFDLLLDAEQPNHHRLVSVHGGRIDAHAWVAERR